MQAEIVGGLDPAVSKCLTSEHEMIKNKSVGQRGKVAEKAVHKYLEALSQSVTEFDYSRIYDARSAGGKFPSRAGDFEFYRAGHFGLLEVKEIQSDFGLPAKNFGAGQMGKLEKRRLAGGEIVVLVLHTPTGLWRRPRFEWLYERAGQPSWDLSIWPLYATVAQALSGVQALKREV